ncbi:2-polyprenyl-6-methoxyphenol hydroxylase-like FAD-dependent oxidoreductase [Lentzea atacamensis]|uniref:2-polyprenyl-6-methoxyphenol hydroxylase-like FAD-dependent oxidoreductase n=2 Tax=Lentzea atacamensis TaxID=531938 RepID=A0A316HZH8_9PSEU|nr:2-polyprenyl-6-methoxyphenol hydroxylase-like FAD-dependent oxidoreductase [Lentzea atacamensis]
MGAGVSGLAAAYRLLRSDWDVAVPAAATPARPGGIPAALTDFGLNAAQRLGLPPALVERRQPRCDLVAVDAAGVPLAVHPEPPPHRPVLGQDEMLAVLSDALGGEVDRRGAELPVLVADDCGVTAIFANGDEDWFDLVVGADGACSAVRAAVLGHSHCDPPHWSTVHGRIELTSSCAVSMDLTGRSVRLHPLRDKRSAVSFAWRHRSDTPWPEVFADLGWLVPELLSRVDGEPCVQIPQERADRWVHRQIALIGDAAWYLGPHADRGLSLAVGGAELLGGALDIFPGADEALSWWERTLRPYVLSAPSRAAT